MGLGETILSKLTEGRGLLSLRPESARNNMGSWLLFKGKLGERPGKKGGHHPEGFFALANLRENGCQRSRT